MTLLRPSPMRPGPTPPGTPPASPAAASTPADTARADREWQQACDRVRARPANPPESPSPSRDTRLNAARPDTRGARENSREDASQDDADTDDTAPPAALETLAAPLPTPAPWALLRQHGAPPAGAVRGAEPPSATAARLAEAAQQIGTPPAAAAGLPQTWQVELPACAPGWQLHIEQARPQAPLALELRVPPLLAAAAQQQLADLDRRLRDAGHELLRSRLRHAGREGARRRPLDRADGPDEGMP
jgi:hypothetical protein